MPYVYSLHGFTQSLIRCRAVRRDVPHARADRAPQRVDGGLRRRVSGVAHAHALVSSIAVTPAGPAAPAARAHRPTSHATRVRGRSTARLGLLSLHSGLGRGFTSCRAVERHTVTRHRRQTRLASRGRATAVRCGKRKERSPETDKTQSTAETLSERAQRKLLIMHILDHMHHRQTW